MATDLHFGLLGASRWVVRRTIARMYPSVKRPHSDYFQREREREYNINPRYVLFVEVACPSTS
jgi:hypothetical protein